MQEITIALAKGRLAEFSIELLERCGVDCSQLRNPGRRLTLYDEAGGYRFMLVKPVDVPTYVYYGVADIGFVGKDTLMEANLPLYEMLDLGFGKCRLCICGFKKQPPRQITVSNLRVATKYPNIAKRFYAGESREIETIKLNGSIELAPILGLSDVIVDIVETGTTLKQNNLEVTREIVPISARFIANKAAMKFKEKEIATLVDCLAAELKAREEQKA